MNHVYNQNVAACWLNNTVSDLQSVGWAHVAKTNQQQNSWLQVTDHPDDATDEAQTHYHGCELTAWPIANRHGHAVQRERNQHSFRPAGKEVGAGVLVKHKTVHLKPHGIRNLVPYGAQWPHSRLQKKLSV